MALIDAVDPTMEHVLMARLDDLAIKQIDYLVANHAEQDHSGSIPAVLAKYPMAKAICTPRCKGLLMDLLHVSEDRITTVDDKETLSLGDRTLEFIHAAWVHWSETMLTYLKEEKTKMAKYKCTVCGYIYDPEKGDPDGGIKPGTAFEDIPDDWVCPVCGAAKDEFEKVE